MSQNTESIEKESPSVENSIQVPPKVWEAILEKLSPPPFRKRHPILFWGALGILLGLICLQIFTWKSDDGQVSLSEDHLAIIRIRGAILDIADDLKWIRTIEHNPNIKGVLLRIDSPGGGASSSQELYASLKRLASTKPICVSMGTVAASGGLMVSMAAERIFANASTITGSIGVRMDIPQVRGLFDKLGIGQETLVTGPYKDAGSYLRPLSQEEKDYLQGILKDMHEQFVEIVAAGRKMHLEKVRTLATGRIFTGREALSLGLIDEIGGQEEAHKWLSQKTGVSLEKKLVTKPKKTKWYEEAFSHALSLDWNDLISKIRESSQGGSAYFLYQY